MEGLGDGSGSGARKRRKARRIEEELEEASRLESLLFGNLGDLTSHSFGEERELRDELEVSLRASGPRNKDDATGTTERKPAWEDEEEAITSVKLSNKNRLRKLLKEGEDTTVSGIEYVSRLRAQHAKLNPGVSWAELTRGKDLDSGLVCSDSEDADDGILLSNVDLVVKSKLRLPPGLIEISRMRDANAEDVSNAVVQSVEFHKNSQILLTAGYDKNLRFFHIDGKRNPKVQSIFLENFPIHKASFVSDGSNVVAAGRRNFFYLYNMQRGAVEKIHSLVGREEKSLESFEVSPDANLVAFFGNEGYILLTSLKTKQLAGTLKMNGSVRALSFTANGNELLSSGGDGEIYHWDLRTRRCFHRAPDEGCINSTALDVSPNSTFFAAGSDSGVVNLYDRAAFLGGETRPIKAFMNLLTTVDNLKFNKDTQILAMSSRMKRNALKLVHVPSSTVFSNWPTIKTPLQYVHSLDFSPGGGFLAVGNAAGRVLLYRLRHYDHA